MPRESNVYDAATHDNVRRRATIMTMCFRACYKRILMRAKYSLCKKMAKVWTVVPLSVAGGGRLRPHLTQCGLVRGLPPYQVAS